MSGQTERMEKGEMELKVELPETLARFVQERTATGEQSPSDVVSQALMMLQDHGHSGREDAGWLREALSQVDPDDEGEELNLTEIVREGEGELAARIHRR